MKMETLRDLFEIELRYAYDCEDKLVKKGLPTMIENCGSPELRQALEQHLGETRNHITRLQQVFSVAGVEPETDSNDVFDKMSSAVKDSISHTDDGSPVRDAALIVNGNQVEHYEMAVYGSLVSFARQLGFEQAATLLEQTLEEEKQADAKLTQIGESIINERAARERRAA
ncbi:MAG: ferritin-like domain-containing protein [Acidobacteriaceae bacterium]|nr:ferritin-like domain-containing protein [Acidobacteriaceae bacterium]